MTLAAAPATPIVTPPAAALSGGHISIGANSWFEGCEKWWISIPKRIRPAPPTIPFGIEKWPRMRCVHWIGSRQPVALWALGVDFGRGGERIGPLQAVGGTVVLIGIALARQGSVVSRQAS